MDATLTIVLFTVILIFLLIVGLNIAFALLLTGTAGLLFYSGPTQAFTALSTWPFSYCYSYVLVVVPLFVLMGHFAFFAGISRRLFDFAYKWVGQLHGGLAMATTLACACFAAVTGSSVATAATIGRIAMPEMEKYGYNARLATGTLAASGTMGMLIPPSVMLVVYGSITKESVGALLIAGILPGVLSAGIYMCMIYMRCRINPSIAALAPKTSWKEKFRSISQVWGMLVVFTIVMGSIYSGFATPTEAGAVGTLAALIMAFAMQGLNARNLMSSLLDAGQVTAMVFAIVMGASVFGLLLGSTGAATDLAEWMSKLELSRHVLLICILLLYIPLGMFLEPIAMMLLTLPITYPLVISLGFDGLWFGILLVKLAELGMITPPVGINIYVIAGVARNVKLEDVFYGAAWFWICDIITIAILVIWPQITLWLPSKMMG